MIPLKLAYAWTIHKAQGQTIKGKIVLDLGDIERSHGLTYTAFSRATILANIGFANGLTADRIMKKITEQDAYKERLEEQRRLRTFLEAAERRWHELLAAQEQSEP